MYICDDIYKEIQLEAMRREILICLVGTYHGLVKKEIKKKYHLCHWILFTFSFQFFHSLSIIKIPHFLPS